jgi:hypothetical protein
MQDICILSIPILPLPLEASGIKSFSTFHPQENIGVKFRINFILCSFVIICYVGGCSVDKVIHEFVYAIFSPVSVPFRLRQVRLQVSLPVT